jgi:glycosyltransferase involved in cell wall biosynthesis
MRLVQFAACEGLGRGEFHIDLANELANHIDVVLVAPSRALYLNRLNPRIQVRTYDSRNSRNNPWLWRELSRLVRDARPDIVHTHFAKATEIFAFTNRWLRLPHVATKHNPRKGRIFNRLPHVIAVSEQVRKTIEPAQARVIYNGIRPVEVTPRSHRSEPFSMIAVGRLDPIKGFDTLLHQLATVQQPFSLDIVGDGPQRSELERISRDLGLQDCVRFPGFCQDIPQRLQDADLAVISSQKEGGPVVAIEALFYAHVLLSTPVGIVPELLAPPFVAPIEAFSEAVVHIMEHYDSCTERFAATRQHWTPRLNIRSIAEQHLAYYEEILSSG